MPYVTADRSLPRSLDVQISLSRPQAETRTDLSLMACCLEGLGFLPDSERVRFYSTIEAVETDFAVGTEAHFAASAFFNQTPRAQTLALGEVFLSALPAQLVSASLTDAQIAAAILVADGSMTLSFDPDSETPTFDPDSETPTFDPDSETPTFDPDSETPTFDPDSETPTFDPDSETPTFDPDSETPTSVDLSLLDFTGTTTVEGIAEVINTALLAHPVTCTVKTLPGGAKRIVIDTTAVGANAAIFEPVPFASGTFIGDLLNFTSTTGGKVLAGKDSTTIGDELASIQNAANVSGKYIYGWTLGASLRDDDIQIAAAEWVLPRTGLMTLVSNEAVALDASYTADMGPVILASGNRRTVCLYHDNPQRYPDISILAYMLHVNYRLQDSTVTAKFKQLPGIETVQLDETEWSILQEKGYNTYTAVGNDARTYRDGNVSDPGWYMDTVINLDNFTEDLSVNVFNVFLRNKKIPYTRPGQMLLVDACQDTGNQYEYNGTFADREVPDTAKKGGVKIIPAVLVTPTPISTSTVADRTARSGPPIQMTVQEAGAIHSIAINVEVVS